MSNKINLYQAIWHAFFGKKETAPLGINPLKKIAEELQGLQTANTAFEGQIGRAKESLEEVKKLTEYQDQKIARLLTISAFLTAAASTIFSRALEIHPFPQNLDNLWHTALLSAFYILFAIYLMLTGLGALVSFYAMQTRFVWNGKEEGSAPRSFLFYQGIASFSPEDWAKSFLAKDGQSPSMSLAAEYYKNYILESYLVATKIKEKLEYLQPGQYLLQFAIRFLVLWFVSLFLVLICVPKGAAQNISADSTKATQVLNASKTATNGAVPLPAHTSSAPSTAKTP